MDVAFQAYEYQADGSLVSASYRFEGSTETGWTVFREGAPALELGPGYRLLRSSLCGVCSTDLARRFLPFPLPQITGHEVVALDDAGRRQAIEINAPPISRGVESDCPFCRLMPNHCPDRLVLGIHDLPGGFGPYVLAPIHALHPIPDSIDDDAAVLIEPLAAALRAVETIQPKAGQSVAVLGPRKLGMLVLAALAAWRRARNVDFTIAALSRRDDLLDVAREMGADDAVLLDPASPPDQAYDIVVDCTGSPAGLELALRAARQEVHLKSTHGRPAAGLQHLTELVVDELSIQRLNPEEPPGIVTPRYEANGSGRVNVPPVIAWLADGMPTYDPLIPTEIHCIDSAPQLLAFLEAKAGRDTLPRVDAAAVDSIALIETSIRPFDDRQDSLVRPRGAILLTSPKTADLERSPLLRAVWERNLRLTSSRCGDFSAAIRLLQSDARLRALAPVLITHRFPASQTPEAFQAAAGRDSIKAVVRHETSP